MLTGVSRRGFLTRSVAASGFPLILPSRLFGATAPSNMIQIAQIGCGRIARTMDLPGVLGHAGIARVVAVCDLDTVRLADAKQMIEESYAAKLGSTRYSSVRACGNYQELLADKSIDAIAISTPDHWHAQPAMEAALAGKDVYLQKPASLTIHEGRQMADAVASSGRIFQTGSQQRSEAPFRLACELVRNGRLGRLREIYIGLPTDPAGEAEPEMPVPPNLNYEAWLGSTPLVAYTEKRVHPQTDNPRARYGRPGWLRCEQFGAGMITGWGAHHIDTAQLAMGMEHSGPVEIVAGAQFPKHGLWDVHGAYHVRMRYANGVTMYISDKYPIGVKFLGDDGWLAVARGSFKPSDLAEGQPRSKTIDASDLRMLRAGLKDGDIRLHASPNDDHHLDWLTAIQTRQPAAAPAEDAHRSCSACLLAHAAMKLGRELKWDPATERFLNDDAANALLSRPQRAPYGTSHVAWRRLA